jgi:ankyrin repeat protein
MYSNSKSFSTVVIETTLSEESFRFIVNDFKKRVKALQVKVADTQDADGYSPMHLASFYGDFLCVQFLRDLGGNEHIKDFKANKPVLDYAANGLVRGVLIDLKEAARKGD